MTSAAYTLRVWPGGGELDTVTVEGEVDAGNAAGFAAALNEFPGPVVLDLGNLDYLDSAGFAALDQLLAQRKIAVVLPPGSTLRKAASLVGLPHHDDVAAAAEQYH